MAKTIPHRTQESTHCISALDAVIVLGMDVLISGAGIAGPTLAYWLARSGFRPTVVERAQGLRSSGSPVDVRGPAVAVADRMGLMPQLRAAGTAVQVLTFRNARDREVGRVNMGLIRRAAGSREVEIPRGDLATILYEAARDDAEFLFDDTVTSLSQEGGGVEVTFDRAAPRRFDLVVGADGLHSTTRRLAFGPESSFVRHMGVYIATVSLGGAAESDTEMVMYNTPGSAVAIHPSRGTALAAFMFRAPEIPGFDYRDTAQHRRLLEEAFRGAGWRLPALLARASEAEDLYFDAVSQVRLPSWSTGRVALLGDAASCVSLFGDGSSLAMAGASTLASALASTADVEVALLRYEAEHRKVTGPKQRNVSQGAAMLIPATRAGLATRNAATRLWPLAAAAQWTGRKLSTAPTHNATAAGHAA
jgi:2-polyprenyl-6-methoxyphenol hydroxylase-like FAD-dependent oxidoreductase